MKDATEDVVKAWSESPEECDAEQRFVEAYPVLIQVTSRVAQQAARELGVSKIKAAAIVLTALSVAVDLLEISNPPSCMEKV